jgi:hypothetical protein
MFRYRDKKNVQPMPSCDSIWKPLTYALLHEPVEFNDHALGFEGTDRDCKIVSA